MHYLVLTDEEVQLWKEDPFEYFIQTKEQSNQVKGNYLREKALRLIAAIELRFTKFFHQFAAGVI
jgi:hypothetical protein